MQSCKPFVISMANHTLDFTIRFFVENLHFKVRLKKILYKTIGFESFLLDWNEIIKTINSILTFFFPTNSLLNLINDILFNANHKGFTLVKI